MNEHPHQVRRSRFRFAWLGAVLLAGATESGPAPVADAYRVRSVGAATETVYPIAGAYRHEEVLLPDATWWEELFLFPDHTYRRTVDAFMVFGFEPSEEGTWTWTDGRVVLKRTAGGEQDADRRLTLGVGLVVTERGASLGLTAPPTSPTPSPLEHTVARRYVKQREIQPAEAASVRDQVDREHGRYSVNQVMAIMRPAAPTAEELARGLTGTGGYDTRRNPDGSVLISGNLVALEVDGAVYQATRVEISPRFEAFRFSGNARLVRGTPNPTGAAAVYLDGVAVRAR